MSNELKHEGKHKSARSEFSVLDFMNLLETDRCLLGLDFGTKNIGVAISDTRKIISSKLKIILNKKPSQYIGEIKSICEQRNIGGIIIGLPLNMNGTEGPRCQATRSFADKLTNAGLPANAFWDERLSTMEAENILLQSNASRKKRAAVVDQIAANIILQAALDRLQYASHQD